MSGTSSGSGIPSSPHLSGESPNDDSTATKNPLRGDDLTAEEFDRYSWQLDASFLGIEAQKSLRRASVLISRIGGVGGTAAIYLAAAGIGRLILAHAGMIRRDDLNRQILMSTAAIGRPRVEEAAERLAALNPNVVIETINENLSATNSARLIDGCQAAVGAAPLFVERFALNAAAVRAGIPLVDIAMYDNEIRMFTIVPFKACLGCLYPEPPPLWHRRFPVLGAVAGVAGALAANEIVRLLAGARPAAEGQIILLDLATCISRRVEIPRDSHCPVCGYPGSGARSDSPVPVARADSDR